jgi:hypothetical protein
MINNTANDASIDDVMGKFYAKEKIEKAIKVRGDKGTLMIK